MKDANLKFGIRLILVLCGFALFAVLFVPIWRIDLDAPQYPEGLRLLIYADKLAGDFEIINGLNHYIGMKTLHAEDFIEFTVLRYIIGFYALLFIVVAAVGNKKFMYVLFVFFAAFGILAMVDFWRWEYNYGHNLDPKAAIVVPGMAYQPPLIGYKQLLNFGAYSMPDIGGWIFIVVGLLLLCCVIYTIKQTANLNIQKPTRSVFLFIIISVLFTSCTVKPKPIKLGINQCDYCKMTISDARFPSEIITQKGKVLMFDDVYCVISIINENKELKSNIKDIYVADYSGTHDFININNAQFYKSSDLRSPMSGNVAAFNSVESLEELMKDKVGNKINWQDLLK
jgi:copper chaperone NosL